MANKIIFAIFLVFFVSACANKNPSQTLNVLFKSEQLKFKGQGFLNDFKGNLELDLYNVGNYANSIKISDKICINKQCYKKRTFNEQFFGKIYYDNLLKDILQCKPIFSKKNYTKTELGFSQKIDNINYEKSNQTCIFKQNKTLIRISIN